MDSIDKYEVEFFAEETKTEDKQERRTHKRRVTTRENY
jgi:hypothetical protein